MWVKILRKSPACGGQKLSLAIPSSVHHSSANTINCILTIMIQNEKVPQVSFELVFLDCCTWSLIQYSDNP